MYTQYILNDHTHLFIILSCRVSLWVQKVAGVALHDKPVQQLQHHFPLSG